MSDGESNNTNLAAASVPSQVAAQNLPVKQKKPRKPNAWHLFVKSESEGQKTGKKPDLSKLAQKYRELKVATPNISGPAAAAAADILAPAVASAEAAIAAAGTV